MDSADVCFRYDSLDLSLLLIPSGAETPEDLIALTAPFRLKRRGVEAKLVLRAGQGEAAAPDKYLIALVVRSHQWFSQLAGEAPQSIQEIAQREGIDASDVGRALQLAFLAPDIVEAILAGRQPVDLTARRLRRMGALPLEWERQRRRLGFSA